MEPNDADTQDWREGLAMDIEAPGCKECGDYHYGACQNISGPTMSTSHPDFRDPPQECLPYCAACDRPVPFSWAPSEYECECGAVGRITWRLRYPADDRNAVQPSGDA